MKGFIEVTNSIDFKYSIRIKHIVAFGDRWIETINNTNCNVVKESYEEIKELIKQATFEDLELKMLQLHESELKTLLDIQQTMYDREVSNMIIQ